MQHVPQASTVSKLAQVAEDQWGLVTRRQAGTADVSPATLQRLSNEGVLERVGHGVYHLAGAPLPDQVPLRAAWLQLCPDTPAWERLGKPGQGVVSHRSAAALYDLGHLPADTHEFTLPARRQTRRPDVRIHRGKVGDDEWGILRGLPVTRPSRIASDLLAVREDPEAVAHVVADAIRKKNEYAATFVGALAPRAAQLGLRRGDGLAVLRWLLELVGDPATPRWLEEAQPVITDITSAGGFPPPPQPDASGPEDG
ncbi:MAG: type IV toxin-antitoxin system AbiEi family antitoxin domain-containing protein [Solirubrobacterales bacterium]